MPKRTNRLAAIDHERRQLANLKTLDPNATPDNLRPLSEALIDLAIAALDEVYRLEEGRPFNARRIELIYHLSSELPNVITFVHQDDAKS
jgi:hypothetical protein